MSKMKKIVSIVFVSFCVIAIIYNFYAGNKLGEDHILTHGSIISADKAGRGKRGPYITYEYRVNGELITSGNRWAELEHSSRHFIGRSFPVVYRDGILGYHDYLLITPEDFKNFGYAFPDSLNWVLEHIKEIK